MALGLVGSFAATAAAQDSGALIDALVRKGVLKDQEAEQIRTQLSRDFAANTPAGKLNLSSSVKELKLSGDVRARWQYDNKDTQTPGAVENGDQRSRFRLRLRVNADYKLNDDFFGGFGVQTEQKNDSGNQTMANSREAGISTDSGSDYFGNYNIYINKAFLGWNPVSGVTLIAGKQVNPFYTTDMVWDADINPTGFTQSVDINKFLSLGGLEVSVRSGQLLVSDSANEKWNSKSTTGATYIGGGTSAATEMKPGSVMNNNRDAWIYQTQIVASAQVVEGVKVTLAPGFYCTNGAYTFGNGNGEANPKAGDNALEGMKFLLLPGDVSFKVAGKPTKFLWDLSYNKDGTDRMAVYNTNSSQSWLHSSTDDLAYLVGFAVGENKKKGDWSVQANYRQVGAAAVDPNVNDSDWALSLTNMRGYKAGLLYNLGDAATVGLTYYIADNLRSYLGGAATAAKSYGDSPVSPNNNVQVLQLDMSIKF